MRLRKKTWVDYYPKYVVRQKFPRGFLDPVDPEEYRRQKREESSVSQAEEEESQHSEDEESSEEEEGQPSAKRQRKSGGDTGTERETGTESHTLDACEVRLEPAEERLNYTNHGVSFLVFGMGLILLFLTIFFSSYVKAMLF